MIFVTGGAGFIGSNFILQWLAQEKSALLTLDKLTYAGNVQNLRSIEAHPQYHFIHGDICDMRLLESLFEKYRPQAVVHFAAETHVDRSIYNPDLFVETNVGGTCALLKAALHFWQKLPPEQKAAFRFLHVSTDEVYGSLQVAERASIEGDPCLPNSPYAASKAAADHFVRAYHHTYGLPTLTTFASNNFGPHQFPEKLIPLAIVNALQGKPIPIYGDGRQIRNWLAVDEHCQALQAVLQKGVPGSSYNIGGQKEVANIDLMSTLCELLDEQLPNSPYCPHKSLITHVDDRPGHDRRYALDSSKIKREIGWQSSSELKSKLRETLSWYLNHRTWIEQINSGEYRHWVEKHYPSMVQE